MKAKLIKTDNYYYLCNESGETIAASWANVAGKKLSKQNCDEIFGVVDVEKLADELYNGHVMAIDWKLEKSGFKAGFNKAMELYQPTEIDVEVVMKRVVDETKVIGVVKGIKGSGDKITTYKSSPKLDENGNLILRKL
jgi:hypothetical protein